MISYIISAGDFNELYTSIVKNEMFHKSVFIHVSYFLDNMVAGSLVPGFYLISLFGFMVLNYVFRDLGSKLITFCSWFLQISSSYIVFGSCS